MSGRLVIAGLNHRSAPVALRERFAYTPKRRAALLAGWRGQVAEAALLCTCNRTEWFAVIEAPEPAAVLTALVAAAGPVAPADFTAHFYVHADDEAVLHLCRVAAGLDSMVTGETQVFGQVKDAFEAAFTAGTAGDQMRAIYQQVLTLAKTVRRETDIGRGAVSVSSMAVQLARNIFEPLTDKTVLLVGAGEMCEQAAEHFAGHGVAGINVVNRDPERARRLAEKFGGQSAGLPDLPTALANADIVLSSTASPTAVITADMVAGAMQRRPTRALLIIDIAVPRDVDERVNDVPEVYLYNIDALERLVADNLKERKAAAVRGEELLRAKLDEMRRLSQEDIGPLIVSLRERAQRLKNDELEKLFKKHADWSDEDRQQVGRSVDLIVNRLLHDPIISLRKGLAAPARPGRSLVEVFREFFNL